MNPLPPDDEALQPLIDQATEGSPATLDELLLAAAVTHLALETLQPPEALPNRLREKLRADLPGIANPTKSGLLRVDFRQSGWLAAAACLALCAFLWQRPNNASSRAEMVTLDQVLAAADLIREPFQSKSTDTGSSGGEVIWSTSLQTGFLRLKGLAANVPNQRQYQLWIVDPLRDPTFPVDGGVFDVRGKETLIPIHAKLGIYSPRAFVITSEQPGGIVKSRSDNPVLLASVK